MQPLARLDMSICRYADHDILRVLTFALRADPSRSFSDSRDIRTKSDDNVRDPGDGRVRQRSHDATGESLWWVQVSLISVILPSVTIEVDKLRCEKLFTRQARLIQR